MERNQMINDMLYELRKEKKTYSEISDVILREFGELFTEEALMSRMKRIKKKKNAKQDVQIPKHYSNVDLEIETNLDGSERNTKIIDLANVRSVTPEILLELHNYDPTQWMVTKSLRKAYNVYSKQDGVKDLYSSSIWVKPIQKELDSNFLQKFFENFEAPILKENECKTKKGYMLELPVMDFHLGKLSWKKETGVSFDLKLGEKLWKDTINDLIDKVLRTNVKIEKIVFPIGQDFFNIDGENNSTTKGTPQDTDVRWQKLFEKGCELIVWAIEKLRKIAPVETMYVPANHDYKFSYFLIQFVKAYYRKLKNVKVDDRPIKRKYIKYGNNLIGMSHGDTEKKRIETLMQSEVPKLWGETLFREWHLGHIHHERTKEINGLIIRHISTVTATDRWHYEQGYTTTRKAQAFIWNKKTGLEIIINSNVIDKKEEE